MTDAVMSRIARAGARVMDAVLPKAMPALIPWDESGYAPDGMIRVRRGVRYDTSSGRSQDPEHEALATQVVEEDARSWVEEFLRDGGVAFVSPELPHGLSAAVRITTPTCALRGIAQYNINIDAMACQFDLYYMRRGGTSAAELILDRGRLITDWREAQPVGSTSLDMRLRAGSPVVQVGTGVVSFGGRGAGLMTVADVERQLYIRSLE